MSFEERLNQIADKVQRLKDNIGTEEATKSAFIMPFISDVLGYDVFDPEEVIPEFTADVGVKKNEKVDYALMLDGQVQILVECKKIGSPLSLEHASQLYRYFACTKARIGVLTNGQVWQFYMDLDEPNRMDSVPFLTLDVLDIDKAVLPELQKLTKPSFDIDSITNSAEELKYVSALKRVIAEEFRRPSNDMVRLLAGRVYDGKFRQNVIEKFRLLVEKSMKRFLADQVNDRLASALDADKNEIQDNAEIIEEVEEATGANDGIVTTDEEMAGYRIVKAIACSDVDPKRVTMRDAKSYCAIFLDDNNRRPIARLFFNSQRKSIGLFVNGVMQDKVAIDSLDDIYRYAATIRDEVIYLTAEE